MHDMLLAKRFRDYNVNSLFDGKHTARLHYYIKKICTFFVATV
jgi:hypothetical protein